MARRVWPLGPGSVITSPFGPRDGGFHAGIDFGGAKGPMPGAPVYAIQSGTVIYHGAAQGYGGPDPAGWLVIDSDDSEGSGVFEYGHIIRDSNIRTGVQVTAGQRIGVINPSTATNGGVTPHLHVSRMPYAYDPSQKQDFRAMMDKAEHIGPATSKPPTPPKEAPVSAATEVVEQLRGIARKGWDKLAPQPDDQGNRYSYFLSRNVAAQTLVEAVGTLVFELTVRLPGAERGLANYRSRKGDTLAGNAANSAAMLAQLHDKVDALKADVEQLKNR